MSIIRQPAQPVLRTVAVGFSSGYHWRSQKSDWGQLIWASRGVISVTIDQKLWVVPSYQALWVPRNAGDSVHMSGQGVLRRFYFARALCRRLPRVPHVIGVAPLLHELLRRITSLGTLSRSVATEARLLALLLDELNVVHVVPVELPMPRDPRARRAADYVRNNPLIAGDVVQVARHAQASVRTLERLFSVESGLSFGVWRQRARLVHAMTLLADGASVTAVGFSVGYATTSAFVAAFRRLTGVTPGKYSALPL